MFEEVFPHQLRIDGIIFGATNGKGFAKMR